MRLSINQLWSDEDGIHNISLHFEGNGHQSTVETHLYPDALGTFGESLEHFPKNTKDECVFEVGSPDPKYYSWVRIRAYTYDLVGHTAIEFSTRTNGSMQVSAESRFSVVMEAASINQLGRAISRWAANPGDHLEFTDSK